MLFIKIEKFCRKNQKQRIKQKIPTIHFSEPIITYRLISPIKIMKFGTQH